MRKLLIFILLNSILFSAHALETDVRTNFESEEVLTQEINIDFFIKKVQENEFAKSKCITGAREDEQEVFIFTTSFIADKNVEAVEEGSQETEKETKMKQDLFDRAYGFYENNHEEAGERSATEQTVRDRLISLLSSSTSFDVINENVVGVIINNSIYYIDFRYPLFANPTQYENRDTKVLYRFSRAECY